jgi:signal transduction histidine kinase
MIRFLVLWILAPLSALALAAWWLRAPISDLQILGQIFILSEGLSLALGWSAYRLSLRLGLASVQLKIALTFALGLGVTLLNVLFASIPMFISAHDSGLLIVLLFFATLVALGFGQLMARSITGGLEHLARTAEKISSGDQTTRAQVQSGDEVELVADAFNRMVQRLAEMQAREKELEQARRSLVAAVSHDLRTPLTSLRAMIEAVNDGVVTDEASVRRYLSLAQLEIQNLSSLVDDLFELTQLDAGASNWTKEPASLRDLISDTLESMRAQALARGVTLSGSVDPAIDPVLMNSFKIQRVLYNLVQNAIRHTPAGGQIDVIAQLCAGGRQVEVQVADTGEGIALGDLPHVFEPFYRSEK